MSEGIGGFAFSPQKAEGRGQSLPESCGLLLLLEGPSLWPLLLAAGVRFDGGPVC